MERTRALACAALLGVAVATGCSGGSKAVPDTTGTVQFSITVPVTGTGSSTRKPDFAAPAGTQSVSISLTSVNGAAQTGQATIANLSSTATGCTSSSSQLTCTVAVKAPAGTDVFTVTTYGQSNAQGAALGKGTVSVQTTQGQTTTAPVSLSGTVAAITLSLGAVPVNGMAATIPLVIVAKDSSGATIMGTFSNPITLADSDTSGATKLSAATIADSAAASAVTIAYNGASLSGAAQITAASSGVPASAITNVSFNPNKDYAVNDGAALTYNVSGSSTYSDQGSNAQTQSYSETQTSTYSTGASFNGQSNLIKVHNAYSNMSGISLFADTDEDYYYTWTPTKTGANLNEVAWTGSWTDSQNKTQTEQSLATGTGWQIAQVPFASGNTWNEASGYVYSFSSPEYDSSGAVTGNYADTFAQNVDGSFTETHTSASSDGSSTYKDVTVLNPDGSGTDTTNLSDSSSASTDVLVMGTPEPAPTGTPGTVIKFTETYTQVQPVPSASPTPNVYYEANWYPNGKAPSPLQSDVATDMGPVAIPSQCNIPSSTATTADDIREKYTQTNPWWNSTYDDTADDYYVPGIGLVCAILNDTTTDYNTSTGQIAQTYVWTRVEALSSSTLQTLLQRTGSMSAAAAFTTAGLQAGVHEMRQQVEAKMRSIHAQHRMQALRLTRR